MRWYREKLIRWQVHCFAIFFFCDFLKQVANKFDFPELHLKLHSHSRWDRSRNPIFKCKAKKLHTTNGCEQSWHWNATYARRRSRPGKQHAVNCWANSRIALRHQQVMRRPIKTSSLLLRREPVFGKIAKKLSQTGYAMKTKLVTNLKLVCF